MEVEEQVVVLAAAAAAAAVMQSVLPCGTCRDVAVA